VSAVAARTAAAWWLVSPTGGALRTGLQDSRPVGLAASPPPRRTRNRRRQPPLRVSHCGWALAAPALPDVAPSSRRWIWRPALLVGGRYPGDTTWDRRDTGGDDSGTRWRPSQPMSAFTAISATAGPILVGPAGIAWRDADGSAHGLVLGGSICVHACAPLGLGYVGSRLRLAYATADRSQEGDVMQARTILALALARSPWPPSARTSSIRSVRLVLHVTIAPSNLGTRSAAAGLSLLLRRARRVEARAAISRRARRPGRARRS